MHEDCNFSGNLAHQGDNPAAGFRHVRAVAVQIASEDQNDLCSLTSQKVGNGERSFLPVSRDSAEGESQQALGQTGA